MKEKLKIAKRLRLSKKKLDKNSKHRELISKCYSAYVWQCIFQNKESFTLYFGSYYMQSFVERMTDWCMYGLDSIHRLYLVKFKPNDDKTLGKWSLIHCGVNKPIHVKMAYSIDEIFLEYYLRTMGFKIVGEKINSLSSTYEVVKI